MNRLFFITFIVISLGSFSGMSQDLTLGQWRVHLPFIKARAVAKADDRIYCASDRGLFYYSQNDNSVEPLSKISGLSELNVSTLGYNQNTSTLLIAYSNANIDLLVGNKIYNLSDIKRKNLTGDKNIYAVTFRNNFAYLSCGFGIVVVDLARREIKDTYIIGPGGTTIRVFDIDFLGNTVFAATESGVFTADINNSNLGFYDNWTLSLPDNGNAGDYNIIETFGNQVFVNYAKPNAIGANSTDEGFVFNGSAWIAPPVPVDPTKYYSYRSSNGQLIMTNSYSARVFDSNLNQIQNINNSVYADPVMRDAMPGADGITWVADNEQGLVRVTASGNVNFIYPGGPRSDLVSAMAVSNGHLWATHATRTAMWFNTYAQGNFSEYKNGTWKTYNNKTLPNFNIGQFYDNMSIAVDPKNSAHVYVGSKGNGIVEMLYGVPVASYRDTNSTLQPGIGNPLECQVVGMGFDESGNLWALNSLAAKPVNVRTTEGQWKAFSIPGIPGAPLYGDLTIDSYGQKWINILGNNAPLGSGLVVFNDNGTLDDITDDRSRFLTTGPGRGNLPSVDIRAITEDLENEIWLGTGKGVAVIYSPSSVITSDNFDAQQILIKQDGVNQYLLETEVVTAIAVDGANRKWIGTESGGAFLMSPDGTKQILNFNEQNSPILSNYILSIAIDQLSGDVYFGTNRGIISYKGDAIAGNGGCNNPLVYPNPVRENYEGPIAIKGLVPNGNVKITDVSGNIVYETTANGTQAIWYGKNFEGAKVQTGVYLVFSTDDEGKNTCVTKLLFVN
jgi:ligand-binding sensor domain-containing protein